MDKHNYELRQIEAWAESKGCWYWNNSFLLTTVSSSAEDVKRLFLRELHKLGIICRNGTCYVSPDGGDIIELRKRKTDEPLFAFIPMDY